MDDFSNIYLGIYRKYRKPMFKHRLLVLIKSLIILLIGMIGFIILYKLNSYILSFVLLLLTVVFILLFNGEFKYVSIYRENILSYLIKTYNNNLFYSNVGFIDKNIYCDASLHDFYDDNALIVHSSNSIHGTINNLHEVTLSSIIVKTKRVRHPLDIFTHNRNGYNFFYDIPIYKGLFLSTRFTNYVSSTIILDSTNSPIKKIIKGSSRVKIEYKDFEKIYDVYSSNNSIYNVKLINEILNNKVLDELIELNKMYKISHQIIIKNSDLYIRLKESNLFNLPLFSNPLNKKCLEKKYKLIKFVFDITSLITENIDKGENV